MPTGIAPISAASFDATAYLDRIRGTTPVEPVTPVPSPSEDTGTNTNTTNNNVSTTGTGQVEFSSNILSLLQSADSNSRGGNLLGNLFDSSGTATSSYLSGLYDTVLFSYSSARPIAQALAAARNQSGNSNNNPLVQNLIESYQNVQNASSAAARQTVQTEISRILGGQNSLIA